jgi:hypothetical protein
LETALNSNALLVARGELAAAGWLAAARVCPPLNRPALTDGGSEASAHFIRFPERKLSQQQQQQSTPLPISNEAILFLVGEGQLQTLSRKVVAVCCCMRDAAGHDMWFDFVFTAKFKSSVDGRNFQAGTCFLYISPTCQVIARIGACLNMPMLLPARM